MENMANTFIFGDEYVANNIEDACKGEFVKATKDGDDLPIRGYITVTRVDKESLTIILEG